MSSSPSKPPILVFDLDGTLAETAGDLIGALNTILEREGMAPVSLKAGREMVGAGGRVLLQHGFAASGGGKLDPDRLEKLFADYLKVYEKRIAQESHLFPGLIAALNRFEAAGWIFAVCTNKVEHASLKLLKALDITDRFKAICGQDSVYIDGKAVMKPDPRVLRATIERAGGNPAHTVMIGDSKTDIRTAQAAGMPVVAVNFGYTDQPVETFEPNVVISSFDQLWDAVANLRFSAS